MTFDDEFSRRLRSEAEHVPEVAINLTEVRIRAQRRRVRTRVMWSGALGVLVVLGAVGAVQLARQRAPENTDGVLQVHAFVASGPEPQFDLGGLGPELRLLDIEPPSTELDTISRDLDLDPTQPVIVVGELEGTSVRVYRASGYISPGANTRSDSPETTERVRCDWVFGGTEAGWACNPNAFSAPLVSLITNEVMVWVNLPRETAVVLADFDGEIIWQRPKGQTAVFPLAPGSSEDRPLLLWALDEHAVPLVSSAGSGIRAPLPDAAKSAGPEELNTSALTELADLRPQDSLFSLGDHRMLAFVRVRYPIDDYGNLQIDPLLLFGTSCAAVQPIPLPTRWEGACLAATDEENIGSLYLYGREQPSGAWSDDGWGEYAEGPALAVSPPSTTPGEAQLYQYSGWILDEQGSGPQLCLSLLYSLPPQCNGLPVAEFDWSNIPWAERASTLR